MQLAPAVTAVGPLAALWHSLKLEVEGHRRGRPEAEHQVPPLRAMGLHAPARVGLVHNEENRSAPFSGLVGLLGQQHHRAGFAESSAFSKAFKGWTGTTPYTYRKGLRATRKPVGIVRPMQYISYRLKAPPLNSNASFPRRRE